MHKLRALLLFALGAAACGEGGDIALRPASGAGGTAGAGTGGTGAMPCAGSNECVGEQPFCDPTTARCVECLLPGHCETGQTCDTLRGECENACTSDAECNSGDTKRCDTARGVCVECLSGSDCSSGSEPFCILPSGRCRQCRTDLDCTDSGKPYCPPLTHECGECLVNEHCNDGKLCDLGDYQCRDPL